jgi:adenylosuccinate synthase
MEIFVVVGAQYGDEGKGKTISSLINSLHRSGVGERGFYDGKPAVVRANGGPNAGHTIKLSGRTIAHKSLPVGVSLGCRSYIGAGCVIDPLKLADEIRAAQLDPTRLYISERAHLILPKHIARDQEQDEKAKIGTTGTGNGPTYADKASRVGIRAGVMLSPGPFSRGLEEATVARRNEYFEAAKVIAPFIGGAEEALCNEEVVIVEGAHGVMLDPDLGVYPYVTSSPCTPAGMLSSLGLAMDSVVEVIGVMKPYITRSGAGPMPTELTSVHPDDLMDFRALAGEFGVVTRRPRRVGWLSLDELQYAHQTCHFTSLAINKLDVRLPGEAVLVGSGWKSTFSRWRSLTDAQEYAKAKPKYIELPNWHLPEGSRDWHVICPELNNLLLLIHGNLGLNFIMMGTGPGPDDVILGEKLL